MNARCRSEDVLTVLAAPKPKPKLRRRPSQILVDFINRRPLVSMVTSSHLDVHGSY